MCTTRDWKRFEVNEAFGVIFARRSDNVTFQFYNLEFKSPVDFVKRLEEFRNCKCSSDGPCNIHIEEKERLENAR